MDLPPDLRIFASERARRRFVLHAILVSLVIVAGFIVIRQQFAFLFEAEGVRLTVRRFGPWAPLVLIGLQALQVVVAPVPGHILAAVAGYLFGPWWGTLYNMIGITIGSTTAFWLSRRYGRSYVERMIDPDALATFDGVVDRHGVVSLFVLFLVPGLPDDALCFIGGLTPIPLWKLVTIAIVGRAPAFFLVNVFGDFVATGARDEAILVLALIVGLSVIGVLNRDRIVRFYGKVK